MKAAVVSASSARLRSPGRWVRSRWWSQGVRRGRAAVGFRRACPVCSNLHIDVKVKPAEGEAEHMRIGELSQRTGTPRRLLRYDEEQSLIVAGRSANGYRDYDEYYVDRVLQIRGEGHKVALFSYGARLGECLEGRRRAGRPRSVDHRCRRPLCQAARHRPAAAAGARARGADHHRGRLDRRLRLPRAADAGRERRARRRPARFAAWCCPTSSSTRTRRPPCTPRPASTPAASSPRRSRPSARTLGAESLKLGLA